MILPLRSCFQQALPKTDIPRNIFPFVVNPVCARLMVVSLPYSVCLMPFLYLMAYHQSVPSLSSINDCTFFITDEMEADWDARVPSLTLTFQILCISVLNSFILLEMSEESVVGRYSSPKLNHSFWLLEKRDSYICHLSCTHPSS